MAYNIIVGIDISIHALLAESDNGCGEYYIRAQISIHALLAESDLAITVAFIMCLLFLSTLSLRRATRVCQGDKFQQSHFYPRSPCGERPYLTNYHFTLLLIFLSTLSLRRATRELV